MDKLTALSEDIYIVCPDIDSIIQKMVTSSNNCTGRKLVLDTKILLNTTKYYF